LSWPGIDRNRRRALDIFPEQLFSASAVDADDLCAFLVGDDRGSADGAQHKPEFADDVASPIECERGDLSFVSYGLDLHPTGAIDDLEQSIGVGDTIALAYQVVIGLECEHRRGVGENFSPVSWTQLQLMETGAWSWGQEVCI